ncbi:hypothetical protein KKE06_02935 [Candidatus Micrarchaeota archaeon]|nr:hypothetical protein [Candidatus Micrarchaeota archaeon]MBU1930995.1 hypothetical protein [Candidatus Micrarchaeota archaeon]
MKKEKLFVFYCQCGHKDCRKKVIDFFALPPKVQEKYLKLGAVPDFIKKKKAEKKHVLSGYRR